jgi:hypothetical protein
MDTKKAKELIESLKQELQKIAEAEFKARRTGGLRALASADEGLNRVAEKIERAEKASAGRTKKAKKGAADTSSKKNATASK